MTREKDTKDNIAGLRKRAEKTLNPQLSDTEGISSLSPEEVQRLVHELRVHQIELEMQNEDLRQSQMKLEELKDKYLDLYDFAPVGYVTLNDKGLILEANLTAVRLLGVEKQRLIKKPFSGFVCQPYVDAYYLHLQQVFETKSKQTCEIELKRKEGSHFFAQMECIALEDENGQSNRCRAIIVDITERKKREEALQDSWSELHAIYEYAPIMMCVLDGHRKVLYANRAFVQFVGKNESELKEGPACGVFGCINSFDDPRGCGYGPRCQHCSIRLAIEDTYKTGIGHREIEYRSTLIGKDCRREIVLRGSTALIEASDQSNVLLCLEDITELQRTLKALRVSEERFRLALDATRDALWDWDMTTGAVFRSARFYEMLGCEREGFSEKIGDWHHLVLPEDYATVQRKLAEYLEGIGERHEVEFRVRKPSGEVIWIQSCGQVVVRDETGKPLRMVGTHADITERKKFEEELGQSEKRFRVAMDAIDEGIWDWNIQTGAVYYSPGWKRILEWEEGELNQDYETWESRIHFDDRDHTLTCLNRLLSGELPLFSAEHRLWTKTGSWKWVLGKGSVLERDSDGHPTRMIGTMIDIHEQKQSDEALKENEERYRQITECSLTGIFIHQDGVGVYVNQRLADMLGYAKEEMIGKPLLEAVHPEDRETVIERATTRLSGAISPSAYELRLIKKSGEEISCEVLVTLIEFQGRPAIMGNIADVTERKGAEEALKKSESLLRNILEQSPYAIWIGDSEGTLVRTNKACRESLRIADEEVVGKYNILEDSIVREKGLLAEIQSVFDNGKVARLEIEYDTSKLTQFQLREKIAMILDVTVFPVLDHSGKIMNIVVQHIDITERKRMEETLRASEERFRTLLEVSPTGFWATDPFGKNTYVSPYWTNLSGISKEDARGDGWSTGLHPDDKDAIFTGWSKAALEEEPYVTEFRFIHVDGHTVWVLCQALAVKRDDGSVAEWLGTITDITDRKKAEEALKESEARYRGIFEGASEGILVVDNQTMRFRYANQAMSKMLGYSQDELRSLRVHGIHPGDRSDDVIREFQAHARGEKGKSEAIPFLKKDGTILYADVSTTLMEIDGAACNVGFVSDITDRKKAEEALAESELLYRTLFEGARDAIMLIDMEGDGVGRIVSANPIAAKIHGYSLDEFMTLRLEDLETPDSTKGLPGRVETALSGQLVRGELNHRRKDGSVFPVDISANLFEIRGHHYCIAIDRDISERKLAEDALRESEARVRAKLESILSPEGDIGTLELADVMDIEQVQVLMDDFYSVTKIGMAIVDLKGKVLVATGWQDICTNFHRVHPETRQNCIASDTELSRGTKEGEFKLYKCLNSMWDIATPLVVGGNHLGNLFLGQFLFEGEEPDLEVFRKQARKYGFDEARYLSALERVPRWTRETVDKVMGFYSQLTRMLSTLSYANIELARILAEQERLFSSLRESEERYRAVVDNLHIGISVINRNMEVVAINPFFAAYYPNVRAGEGQICYTAYNDPPRSSPCSYCPCVLTFQDGDVHESETDSPAGGQIRHYRIVSCPVKDEQGEVELVIELVEDVTERRSLYAQLAQAQKMEAVGTLAGGVAHDFNNILQVSLGYSEIMLDENEFPERYRPELKKIYDSAKRGADLVQRLLTFSRKTEISPKNLDLNVCITDLRKMIERTLPKMIDIHLVLNVKIAKINADKTQIDQVLMNLAVNARDAMPDGGKLLFETANVTLDEEYTRTHFEANPGPHVLLMVSDTGSGMDKDTLEHIFEPFYTTKGIGEGTGLGLAMVHGIVKHHGGSISCHSEPGKGTTFKIYFPAVISEEEEAQTTEKAMPRGGSETILLVDDEESIRDLAFRILTKAGYNVITASNGREAIAVYPVMQTQIHLVLLDLIMPDMG